MTKLRRFFLLWQSWPRKRKRHGAALELSRARQMARTGHNTFLTAGLFLLDTPGALMGRDVHLGIAARRGSIDSGHNSFSVAAQNRPLGIAKNDDSDFPSRQVLLIAKVLVRSQQ